MAVQLLWSLVLAGTLRPTLSICRDDACTFIQSGLDLFRNAEMNLAVDSSVVEAGEAALQVDLLRDIAGQVEKGVTSAAAETFKAGQALIQLRPATRREAAGKGKKELPYAGDPYALAKKLLVPVVGLILGVVLLRGNACMMTFGKVFVFFGAQTFMNLYMKSVLSTSPVAPEQGMRGFPAAFAVTGIQMITSFVMFVLLLVVLWPTPWRYRPKMLTSCREWITVVTFSITFTLNIALNNFSLMILPISVNLIIRSSTPIATYAAQRVMSRILRDRPRESRCSELVLMVIGVSCAIVAVVVKAYAQSVGLQPVEDEPHLILGAVVCLFSLLAAAVNVVLAGVLGSSMSLNPLDTVLYMSLPAFLSLLLPTFLISHVSNWAKPPMTDWEILKEVARYSPGTIGLAVLSGVFALVYNILQYFIVQTLSATYAAFAGNFNKAATIAIAIGVGLEVVPQGKFGMIMVLGIMGNIICFMCYSMFKAHSHHRRSLAEKPWVPPQSSPAACK